MTGRPIDRYRIDHRAAVQAAAARIRRAGRPADRESVIPVFRQAQVVSNEGSTVTVRYDLVTPGPSIPGIRYNQSLTLAANDLVYTATLSRGNTWVVAKLGTAAVAPVFQSGTVGFTLAGGAGTFPSGTVAAADSGSVTFTNSFGSTPRVQLTVQISSAVDTVPNLTARSSTGFSWRVFARDPGTSWNGATGTLVWFATDA